MAINLDATVQENVLEHKKAKKITIICSVLVFKSTGLHREAYLLGAFSG